MFPWGHITAVTKKMYFLSLVGKQILIDSYHGMLVRVKGLEDMKWAKKGQKMEKKWQNRHKNQCKTGIVCVLT